MKQVNNEIQNNKIKSSNIEKDINDMDKEGYDFVCFVGWFGNQSILSTKHQILFKKRKGG